MLGNRCRGNTPPCGSVGRGAGRGLQPPASTRGGSEVMITIRSVVSGYEGGTRQRRPRIESQPCLSSARQHSARLKPLKWRGISFTDATVDLLDADLRDADLRDNPAGRTDDAGGSDGVCPAASRPGPPPSRL